MPQTVGFKKRAEHDPDADGPDSNLVCHYSHIGRRGKPKGSKNKKTLEKERIKALCTLDSSTRRTDSQRLQGSRDQPGWFADGLVSHGILASPPQPSTDLFSPNALEYNLLDPVLETLEMEASSRRSNHLSETAMLDPIMQQESSLPFAFSVSTTS